jgi:hypothetical protein
MQIISHGALLVFFLTLLYVAFSIKILLFIKNTIKKTTNIKLIDLVNIITIVYLSSFALVVSMIHYGTLLRPGARVFFAFQIAFSLVLLKKAKHEKASLIKESKKNWRCKIVDIQ